MKQRKFLAFMLIIAVSLFLSCSDDDDNNGTSTDYAKQIEGTYSGEFSSPMDPETHTEDITIKRTADNKISFLADIHIIEGQVIKLSFAGIDVEGSEGNSKVTIKNHKETVTINLGDFQIESDVKVYGHVIGNDISLNISFTVGPEVGHMVYTGTKK